MLRREAASLRARLVWMGLACVLPVALTGGYALVHAHRQDAAERDAQAQAQARAMLQRLEGGLSGSRAALLALGASPALADGDWAAFAVQAEQVARLQGAERIVLLDSDGRAIVEAGADTDRGFAGWQPLPAVPADVGIDVAVPVSDGWPRRELRASFSRAWLAGLVIPPAQTEAAIGLLDDSGRLLAGTAAAQSVRDWAGASAWQAARAGAAEGLVDAPPGAPAPARLAYSRSAAHGLAVVVGVREPARLGGWPRDLSGPLGVLTVLVLAGMAAAVAAGRGIATSVDGVLASAQALGRGETLSAPDVAPSPPLRETRATAAALVAASRLLSSRTQQLDHTRRAFDALNLTAHHDALTTLLNRRSFLERLDERVAARRADGGRLTVFFVDLDDFKAINDSWGHAFGDAVLQAIASRLRGAVRDDDVAGRLGGDEFAVIIDGLGPAEAEPIAQALLDRLSQPYVMGGRPVQASASIGLAGFPADGRDALSLLDAADRAMYQAKALGKAAFRRSDWAGH